MSAEVEGITFDVPGPVSYVKGENTMTLGHTEIVIRDLKEKVEDADNNEKSDVCLTSELAKDVLEMIEWQEQQLTRCIKFRTGPVNPH